jgi:hypothetical protein
MINKCSLSSRRMNVTIPYEYNIMCIAQLKGGRIKGARTKACFFKVLFHIWSSRSGDINTQWFFFFLHDNLEYLLQSNSQIKCFRNWYKRSVLIVSEMIDWLRGRNKYIMHSFSLLHGFVPLDFPDNVFNEIYILHIVLFFFTMIFSYKIFFLVKF